MKITIGRPSVHSKSKLKRTVLPSAFQLSQILLSSSTVSGRRPSCFESQRILLSGSICFLINPVMVGPKVFSWSEPIQTRNLHNEVGRFFRVSVMGTNEPVWILNAGGQSRSNTRAGADPYATTEHGRSVPNTGCEYYEVKSLPVCT